METTPCPSPATVEAIGRIHVSDWQTYVEIWFGEELPKQMMDALQHGKRITVTFQISSNGMQSQHGTGPRSTEA